MAKASRVAPHSLDAEARLLSNCMLDGAEIIARCLIERVTTQTFYDPKHGVIFGVLVDLYNANRPTDIAVVAEELATRKKLAEIGGVPFLTSVTSSVSTTAQATEWISKVKEYATLRDAIRTLTTGIEDAYNFTGNISEFLSTIRTRVDKIDAGSAETPVKDAGAFLLPPENDPNMLLGKHRYIGRGDSAIIVSSSGMGKSVLQIEWAVFAALGWDFVGIKTQKPLKSLIIQAEDSDGDVGEVLYSIRHALKLTDKQWTQVCRNVRFVREKEKRGQDFIVFLRRVTDREKPDLVWLNPLHAYAGCDIADARELGHFLRAGLNSVNREERFAYMVVHHTPKPITGKGVADKKWHEFMYDAAGSAELVNWARAVITLKPTETEGDFNLVLAKRGKRAGVTISVPGEGDGVTRLEITTKVPIKHSKEYVTIEGRKEQFALVHWEERTPDAPTEDADAGKRGKPFPKKISDGEIILSFPPQTGEGNPISVIMRMAIETTAIPRSTFYDRKNELKDAGLIELMEDGRWRRTALGDELAKKSSREIL